jgi:hypothetical protein
VFFATLHTPLLFIADINIYLWAANHVTDCLYEHQELFFK